MMATFRTVLHVSKEVDFVSWEDNLFLFKFGTSKDKQRVIDGSPWSFDRQLLLFEDYNGDKLIILFRLHHFGLGFLICLLIL